MSKSANKTLIGAFVVGATALLLLAIAVFGSGKLSFDFHWADGIQKLGDIDEFLRRLSGPVPRRPGGARRRNPAHGRP